MKQKPNSCWLPVAGFDEKSTRGKQVKSKMKPNIVPIYNKKTSTRWAWESKEYDGTINSMVFIKI